MAQVTQQPQSKEDILRQKELKWETRIRRIRWLFSSSGVLALAFEHFLAMVPATILVPIMVNNTIGETVIDMSMVLLTSGLGTILFLIITKGTIPAYLGSSFAYIGLTIYLVQQQMNEGLSAEYAYVYVGWSYIFSGVLLVILSLLYKQEGIEKALSFVLPPAVVGPAISLIGLELADTAIVDSGFDVVNGLVDVNSAIVALTTLVVIVILSLTQRKRLKNAAIIIGMIVGYTVYVILNGIPTIDWNQIEWLDLPKWRVPVAPVPENWPRLLVSVLPATFIVFTENIGRVTVINRMVKSEDYSGSLFNSTSVQTMGAGLFAHGWASIASTIIGSVPNTIYAENIAVMGIHKSNSTRKDPDEFVQALIQPFSWVPYLVAALIAILFSFVAALQSLLVGIPKCVIGGMELFLFGIISAPGIQLLVDQRVNYGKVSNQIITAAVLISGISGMSIDFGVVELKGMGLGFVVGVGMNLVVQFLNWMGILSDTISFDELLVVCMEALPLDLGCYKLKQVHTKALSHNTSEQNASFQLRNISVDTLYQSLSGADQTTSAELIRDLVKHSDLMVFGEKEADRELVRVQETANGLFVSFIKDSLNEDEVTKYLNDYPEAIDIISQDNQDYLCINIAKGIPVRKIKHLIRCVSEKPVPV